MPQPMTSCDLSGRGSMTSEVCGNGPHSGISLTHEATVCQILGRSATTTITPTQRAPGIWSLSASNTIPVVNASDRVRDAFGIATSVIVFEQGDTIVGGRLSEIISVNQPSHGLSEDDWIILDSVTLDWTEAFDAGATIEDDAPAQVVNVVDADNFQYKPIGPVCSVIGLIPGRLYYVATDGSGGVTLTEPSDTSVTRLFTISSSKAIVLPYRPDTGALVRNIRTETSTYTVVDTDSVIICDGTFTLTLITAVGNEGLQYDIKNINTGTITVDGDGTETIDEALTQLLVAKFDSVTVTSDGTNWVII
jgi:hypothetical protein